MENNKNKLVCMLRVKDGILFIKEWLFNMEKLVDEIVVVDNGSTDGTLEIMQQYQKVVEIGQTVGFDEGRDKILLYQMARKRNPDWCMWLDVDEIFEERVTRKHLDSLMNSFIVKNWTFRRFAMKNNGLQFMADWRMLKETALPSRNMWKEHADAYFSGSFIHDGGVHGLKGLSWFSNLRILHLASSLDGYKEYRTQKYKEAKELDSDEERKLLYDRNLEFELNDNYPTWKWHDYNNKKVLVSLQNLYFTIVMFYQYFLRIPRKLKKLIIG
jgi:glycosyltransferase involved in cell wall biosynthesis